MSVWILVCSLQVYKDHKDILNCDYTAGEAVIIEMWNGDWLFKPIEYSHTDKLLYIN